MYDALGVNVLEPQAGLAKDAHLVFRRDGIAFLEHAVEVDVTEVLEHDVRHAVLLAVLIVGDDVRMPQWTATELNTSIRERPARYAGRRGVSAALVVSVNVQRASFFIRRLIFIPLVAIVLLSFSVFWMDQSSLGDRISVSFIGILTGVAYQIVMSDFLPRISYFTLMNAFLNISFLTMCATVVINLVVGALDKRGNYELGDRIDHRCLWIFPLTYLGLILVIFGIASVIF